MKKSVIALSCFCFWACSSGSETHVADASPDRAVGNGGSGSGGETATGGASASGGRVGTGGATGTGGASATGGTNGTGGRTGAGGRDGSGGAASGGRTGAGGATGIAGVSGGGGRVGTGGGPGTGGRTGSGGNTSGGNSGGRTGAGTGGATASGGATAGSTGSCTAPPEASPLIGWAAVSGNSVTTTTGGGSATPVTVTSLGDLQNAVKGTTAAVIYVKGVMAAGTVTVGSNKTIAGLCGAEIHGHVEMSGSVNVIVRNIKIVGYAVGDCSKDPSYDSATGCSSGQDAISLQKDSHHVWFDHCDISDGTDGNLDITNGADFVTVSWTKFHYTPRTDNVGDDSTGAAGHRFSNLVGGSDSKTSDGGKLNVTWHHNWWADNVVERQPRVRFGKNHIFNNLYTSSASSYCVRAGIQAQILLESNVFSGVKDPHEFNNSDDQATAYITVKDNVYTNVSGTKDTAGGGTPFTDPPYDYKPDATASLQSAIQSGAGPH